MLRTSNFVNGSNVNKRRKIWKSLLLKGIKRFTLSYGIKLTCMCTMFTCELILKLHRKD
ncbi:hypothetical protein HanIR_Chr01g0026021 [Helianthus annuus]|nr:hypothetical protein HanIR_Chr01g0026021 [Helianthus annuus]